MLLTINVSYFFLGRMQTSVCMADWASQQDKAEALRPDGAWVLLLTSGKATATDRMQDFFSHFELDQLVEATDTHGRSVLDVATPNCRTILKQKMCASFICHAPFHPSSPTHFNPLPTGSWAAATNWTEGSWCTKATLARSFWRSITVILTEANVKTSKTTY